jgi:hypothetical protein
MKKMFWLLVALLIVCGLVVYGQNSTAAPVANGGPVNCSIPNFVATVRQGPNTGVTLAGTLHIEADAHGSVDGQLQRSGAPDVPVVGQVDGRAINLAFNLGPGQMVYGVGTAVNDIHECSGGMGGPFVGPGEGDSGDWSITSFFPPTATPSVPHAPIIRNPTWNNNKIFMDAAGSYIQTGATLQVSRSGLSTQSWTLSFDQSGTLFQGGGQQPSTPSGYLMQNFVPAGIPVTLVVRNPDGMLSAPVGFQH